MYAVGIDTGGTFTDAFITAGGDVSTVKVETTPHDLTVCFAQAIEASASAVGVSRTDFLRSAEIIRFSSTIGTNTILTRTGPKLGLVVSAGAEQELYGAAEGGTIFSFIPAEMVAGIDEGVGADGALERAPDPEQVNRVVRGLVERGARIVAVSLRNAAANAANERAVKQMIDASYPRHYLGAVPVILSTEVDAAADDAARTAATIVDAYMHRKLATSLYKAEDDLRAAGFRRPLLVVSTDGGVTRVAKTRALATYQSGPTSGIHASALICQACGVESALTADVGGTSTDVGLVIGGQAVRRDAIDVGGLRVAQRSVELVSFGLGGGSIARAADGRLTVGPESAGAAPGPACFGLGGRSATPTDAWLVLGYLDPDYYLGGRKRLDRALSERALHELGAALGLGAEEAALALKRAAEEVVGDGIAALPQSRPALGTAILAYGGGGGILIPAVARRLGIPRVILPRFSPVLSAFGVSTFDVRHRYEARAVLDESDGVVAGLVETALRDMRGEGFDTRETSLAVDIHGEDASTLVEGCPPDELGELPRGVPLLVSLTATRPVAKPRLPEEVPAGPEPDAAALKTTRRILVEEGEREAPVYERSLLRSGNVLRGPAIVEAIDTTYLVPEGAICEFDRLGNAVLRREE